MTRAFVSLVYRRPMERQMLLGDRYHVAGGPPVLQVVGIGLIRTDPERVVITLAEIA